MTGGSAGLFILGAGIASFAALTFAFRRLGQRVDAKTWVGKERLEIVGIRELSHHVKEISLRRLEGKPFSSFSPGQFLTFQISENPADVRSYSLCDSAVEPKVLRVAVKRVEQGLGSSWLHERQVGDQVWVYPPSGHFTDAGLEAETKIYVAGGIGITPLVSMIKTNLKIGATGEMALFYGMRQVRDLAFHDELLLLSQQFPQFKYFPVLMEPSPEWTGAKGLLSVEDFRRKFQSDGKARYFICGPSVMMEGIVNGLLREGTPEEHIHMEKFISRASLDFSHVKPRQARVTIHHQTYNYEGRQTLLEFAESHAVVIPFSCRTGVCGTCKCKVSGPVTALSEAGLSAKERSQGFILACVAFPEGDLELEPIS